MNRNITKFVGFEVISAVIMKICVSWNMTLCTEMKELMFRRKLWPPHSESRTKPRRKSTWKWVEIRGCFTTRLNRQPWRWRYNVSPKHLLIFFWLHVVKSYNSGTWKKTTFCWVRQCRYCEIKDLTFRVGLPRDENPSLLHPGWKYLLQSQ
jgi:hypothetical protein